MPIMQQRHVGNLIFPTTNAKSSKVFLHKQSVEQQYFKGICTGIIGKVNFMQMYKHDKQANEGKDYVDHSEEDANK